MKIPNHRLIAILMAGLLCFTAVPVTAFAVGGADTEETAVSDTAETDTQTETAEEIILDVTEDAALDVSVESEEEMTEAFTDAPVEVTEVFTDAPAEETTEEVIDAGTEESVETETEIPTDETPDTETGEATEEEPAADSEYRVQVDNVSGYHNQPVALTLHIEDMGGTGWAKAEASLDENDPEKRTDLTEVLQKDGAATYTVSANGTVYFFITDLAGVEHKETYAVDFFDYDPPSVEAGIRNKTLTVEASDSRSGVAGIYVNGQLYTTLKNGQLELSIDGWTEDPLFYIRAKDQLGNRSDSLVLSNPYYQEPEDDTTEQIHDEHCPEDCDCRQQTTTTQPTTAGSTSTISTPATQTTPTTTLSAGSTGSSGTFSGSTGSASASNTSSADTSASNKEEDASETVTKEPGTGFSGDSNAVTRDLLYDKYTNKQFITITDRDGNTFYMVIDYDSPINEEEEQYKTYFLNPVDLADLAGLASDGGTTETPAVCSCTDRCQAGAVNMSCEVCAQDMTACVGTETVTEETEETEETADPEPDEPEESGMNPAVLLLLLALIGGGGVLAYFKLVKNKPKTKGSADLDDYDYGDEDEDEADIPWESEDADASDAETDEGDTD